MSIRLTRIAAAGLLVAAFGCHSLNLSVPVLDRFEKPDKLPPRTPEAQPSLAISQFDFWWDFEPPRDPKLFKELADLREQVFRELQLPPGSKRIQVQLFVDRDHYEQFMHARYPDLPKRRAFFVAQPRTVGGAEDLLVYTYWGERVREDLRHELTHAMLHSVLKDVPLWLDEGLAEYYEVPPEWQGVNPRHLEQIRAPGTAKADLVRLEQLSQVQQMTPAEYREAWAWVHLMLRSGPAAKAVLTGYLQQLRTIPNPGLLEPRLAQVFPQMDDALDQHLAKVDRDRHAVPSAQR
jgi:hypothetical protein